MRKLGSTNHSGGVRGDRTRTRNQMTPLFSANVTLHHKNERSERLDRARAPGRTRRPPPAGATTPAIASRSLLFEQIPSVFEQVASAALVTSSPGRGARQLARRRPCFPELQVELSGARRVAVAAAAVGEGSGGNRRRDSACVPRCATTSRCRRPRTPGVVGDSDEDGATLVSG